MQISLLLMQQIAQLFLILLMGYAVVKTGLLKASDSKVLSVVFVYLVMPCVVLNAFQIKDTPEIRTGLTMGVPDPHAVGKDRIVDAAYAAANFPLPVITVDLGTATTFNVVDENRVFRGGVICPGLSTGLRALGERCAQLPQVHLSSPKNAIGTNTESCMLSGSVLGTAVLLDGIAARIEEELGRPATLVVTGGLAKYVTPLCRHPLTYDPELLLKGLALLYQLNAPQHERHHEPRSDGERRRPRPAGRRPYNNGSSPRRRSHNNRRPRRDDEAKAG